jgi:eukaryotic-like serine/threonine-protein kinase
MSASSSPSPPPRVLGSYALFDAIASGGMASVHLGRSLSGDAPRRALAIKRLHEAFAGDPEYVAMMLDEAHLVRCIVHPNVVPTLDVVREDGELWLIMEYVAGESLSTLLKRLRAEGRSAPIPVVVDIVASALRGLHAAHIATSASGAPLRIVHRDVSPQNIIVGADGVSRVLDFGIAKAAGRMQHTRTGSIKGKVRYMAPEQVRGQPTHLTDVYAASIVLWEALTGKRLFTGDNDVEIMYRVIESKVDSPSRWRKDLSPGLEAVVMRGLRKDPAERFPTALAMAEALLASCTKVTREQVARWLSETAGPELARRHSLVASIETEPDPEAPAPPLAPSVPETPSVQVSTLSAFHPVSSIIDGHHRRPRASTLLAAISVILLVLLLPLVTRHAAPPALATPAASSAPVPALDTSPPVSVLPDPPAPAPEPSTAPAPTPTPTPARAPAFHPTPHKAKSPSDRIYQRD